jgi:hypothetical protein
MAELIGDIIHSTGRLIADVSANYWDGRGKTANYKDTFCNKTVSLH